MKWWFFAQLMHNYFNGQGKIQVFPQNVLVRKISKTNWKIYRNWLEISSLIDISNHFGTYTCLKNNYRFNILLVLSKLFESLLCKQFPEFFWKNLMELSMWLCTRKGYGSQHCSQMMLETWRKSLIIITILILIIIKIKRLEHCWQIYLKHLFTGVMIYWLLTFMQTISTYSPVPNCSEIKVHFGANFPIHFTLSLSTFTRAWLEKALLSF